MYLNRVSADFWFGVFFKFKKIQKIQIQKKSNFSCIWVVGEICSRNWQTFLSKFALWRTMFGKMSFSPAGFFHFPINWSDDLPPLDGGYNIFKYSSLKRTHVKQA